MYNEPETYKSSNHNILIAFLLLSAANLIAADRISAPINPSQTVVLTNQIHPRAQPQYDQGPVDPSMPLAYLTLLLKPDPALDAFLRDQQNPASPSYHRWLTPEQFADKFGL